MGKRGRPARIIRSGKPAKCPKCGGKDFLIVVYGYPSNEVIDEIDFSLFKICFDITGEQINKDTPKTDTFAIGPEGGWSSNELSKFKIKYKISEFNLRTETAAISAVSLMM